MNSNKNNNGSQAQASAVADSGEQTRDAYKKIKQKTNKIKYKQQQILKMIIMTIVRDDC